MMHQNRTACHKNCLMFLGMAGVEAKLLSGEGVGECMGGM